MAAKGKFFKAIKGLAGNYSTEEKTVEIPSAIEPRADEQEKLISLTLSSTIISSSMIVEGEIQSSNDLEVMGMVKGPITTTGDLNIKGKVLGDIRGRNVALNGCAVQGNVFAEENLSLDADAIVLGDIQAKNITMNPGAKLNGKVTILSQELKEESLF